MIFSMVNDYQKFALWYFIVSGMGYVVLLLASFPEIKRQYRESLYGKVSLLMSGYDVIPITIIIPAFNEAHRIINCVEALLKSNYQNKKIIVVSDGSTDETVKILDQHYVLRPVVPAIRKVIATSKVNAMYVSEKFPHLTVIDKEHFGASDSLNVGINASQTPLFASIDADTIVDPDALSRVVFTLLSNPHAIAVGGAVYILNGCDYKDGEILQPKISGNLVEAVQTAEYLRSFIFGRSGWNHIKGNMVLSGAFSLFEKELVVKNGGYDSRNTAYDVEVIINLHRKMLEKKYPYKILYNPSAISWTIVPGTLKGYWRQRAIWQKGSLRSAALHKKMFFNFRYGVVGLFNYPFFVLVEIFGAFVEFFTYLAIGVSIALGFFDHMSAILLFLVSWGFVAFLTAIVNSISLISFNRYRKLSDIFNMFCIVILEMFGFRQYIVCSRVWGTIRYFFSKKGSKFYKTSRVKTQ